MAGSDVVDRLRCAAQGIGAIQDRRDLAGLDQHLEGDEIGMVRGDEEPPESLRAEPEQNRCTNEPARAREPSVPEVAAIRDEYPRGGQRAAQVGQRVIRNVVEDDVVGFPLLVKSSFV